MTELINRVRKTRRLLENPYAHIEYLEEFAILQASRRIYENPWAHIEVLDGSDIAAFRESPPLPKKEKYTLPEIEERARHIQLQMWADRDRIWGGAPPSNPIALLDPGLALKLIGYDFELEETLGQFELDGKMIEVAGIIDGPSKHVRISRQFPQNVRSFTAAHELGHAVLHDPGIMHRDRALNGERLSRDSREYAADKFAAFFLMPKKQVRSIFKFFFLTERFFLDEATAFALGKDALDGLERGNLDRRELSKMLANAEQYNGRQFKSLATQFGVSDLAMAIRLEELELVAM